MEEKPDDNSIIVPPELWYVNQNLFEGFFIKQRIQFLEGRVLTLLEATIESESKLKATKDIVRGFFKEKQNEIDSLSHVNLLEA